jgi:riboflavin biosynthesis pyrimidine reductase
MGKMAAGSGASLPISCDEDWCRVHRLREEYDTVAVGARTWIRDQPRLTARSERLGRQPLRQPDRVIFMGRHRPFVVGPDTRRTFVVGARMPRAAGVSFIQATDHTLYRPLEALYRYRIRSMLVEGGLKLLESFLRQGCIDHVTTFVRTDCPEAAIRVFDRALAGILITDLASLGTGVLLTGRRGTGQ